MASPNNMIDMAQLLKNRLYGNQRVADIPAATPGGPNYLDAMGNKYNGLGNSYWQDQGKWYAGSPMGGVTDLSGYRNAQGNQWVPGGGNSYWQNPGQTQWNMGTPNGNISQVGQVPWEQLGVPTVNPNTGKIGSQTGAPGSNVLAPSTQRPSSVSAQSGQQIIPITSTPAGQPLQGSGAKGISPVFGSPTTSMGQLLNPHMRRAAQDFGRVNVGGGVYNTSRYSY